MSQDQPPTPPLNVPPPEEVAGQLPFNQDALQRLAQVSSEIRSKHPEIRSVITIINCEPQLTMAPQLEVMGWNGSAAIAHDPADAVTCIQNLLVAMSHQHRRLTDIERSMTIQTAERLGALLEKVKEHERATNPLRAVQATEPKAEDTTWDNPHTIWSDGLHRPEIWIDGFGRIFSDYSVHAEQLGHPDHVTDWVRKTYEPVPQISRPSPGCGFRVFKQRWIFRREASIGVDWPATIWWTVDGELYDCSDGARYLGYLDTTNGKIHLQAADYDATGKKDIIARGSLDYSVEATEWRWRYDGEPGDDIGEHSIEPDNPSSGESTGDGPGIVPPVGDQVV